jgi:IMP dehydrogenase
MAMNDKIALEGITFDDVLVIPRESAILPRDVSTKTRFTKELSLNIPLVSSAMDTVTESKLAIALAREGGIGILHKNMTAERQAEEVRKVKRAESAFIADPVTITLEKTIGEARTLMRENNISGIPVLDESGKLVGIVTSRDMRFAASNTDPVSSIMTREGLVTAPVGTDITAAQKVLAEHRVEKLPIVNADGTLAGLITYRDVRALENKPLSSKDSQGRLLVGAAVGVTADMIDRISLLVAAGVDAVCIDTAHGHSHGVSKAVREAKKAFPKLQIIAGNIATEAAAQWLIDAGADAVKVGVGPGSICTTRIVAGIGMPQVSAIMEAAKACQKAGVPLIADGGIRYSGDLVKAIAAGGDTVMVGSILAGTDEAPGESIIYDGRRFKSYRGMGSLEAMQQGSKDRYFQDAEDDVKKLVPEGIVGRVAYKGTVAEVIYQYVGGLRAGMGYVGAKDIEGLKTAQFVKITNAGMDESHPHDITITKEAPNYSRK